MLAKWKLAIVLEQGYQRAGNEAGLLAFGPDRARTHALGRRTRRNHRLPVVSSVRAAVCPEYGSSTVVRVQERTTPAPERGQARVRVRAASVNFPDVLLIAGTYQVTVPPPFVPGSEFAGIVAEVGADCTAFAEGDRVAGTSMCGAFGDDIVVEAGSLSRIAEHVDDHTAAAFGVAYRTAYHTLRSTAALRPGSRLSCSAPAEGSVSLPCNSHGSWAPRSQPWHRRPKNSPLPPLTAPPIW